MEISAATGHYGEEYRSDCIGAFPDNRYRVKGIAGRNNISFISNCIGILVKSKVCMEVSVQPIMYIDITSTILFKHLFDLSQ